MDVRPRLRCVASWVGVLVLVGGLIACGDAREHVLVPDGSPMFTIMNFIEPLSLDPLPDGWYHRRFWRHGPMDISVRHERGDPGDPSRDIRHGIDALSATSTFHWTGIPY